MVSVQIDVVPSVLEWAIKESRINPSIIEIKQPKLKDWIAQISKPTFVQLKNLSEFLRVPFGYMFLNEPPMHNVFDVEFRTLNNELNERPSKELEDILIDIKYKQNWISEIRKNDGYEPIDLVGYCSRKSGNIVVDLNAILDIPKDWFFTQKDEDKAFAYLRQKIEDKGIFVMVNGIVIDDTHRKLPIEEFRAFVLVDEYAPFIFINRNDSKKAMIFSLIHEFLHILFNTDDILNLNDFKDEIDLERKINKLTADFLCPESFIKQNWDNNIDLKENIECFSEILKVSKIVVAIAMNSYQLISNQLVEEIKNETDQIIKYYFKETKSGGDYYNNKVNRLSERFIDAVINHAETGNLQFTEAFKLLNVKGSTYDQLKAKRMM